MSDRYELPDGFVCAECGAVVVAKTVVDGEVVGDPGSFSMKRPSRLQANLPCGHIASALWPAPDGHGPVIAMRLEPGEA